MRDPNVLSRRFFGFANAVVRCAVINLDPRLSITTLGNGGFRVTAKKSLPALRKALVKVENAVFAGAPYEIHYDSWDRPNAFDVVPMSA